MADNEEITLKERVKIWMQAGLSVVTFAVAIIVVLFYDGDDYAREVATGWAGIILGFWFSL